MNRTFRLAVGARARGVGERVEGVRRAEIAPHRSLGFFLRYRYKSRTLSWPDAIYAGRFVVHVAQVTQVIHILVQTGRQMM